MRVFFTITCFFMSFLFFAQINYESGYIINNQDSKIDCLIRNSDWSNNPSEIQYKLSEDSETITGNISDIKAFQIGDNLKYVRATIPVDQSSANSSNLSSEFDPKFTTETTFLRQIVSGEANLYHYQNNRFERFFYNYKSSEIRPLVYKQYYVDNSSIGENFSFRKELFDNLKCSDLDVKDFRDMTYNQNDFIAFFSKFNMCVSGENTVLKKDAPKGSFNFRVKAGLGNGQLKVDFDEGALRTDAQSTQFESEITSLIGMEVEYVLPFNKNKWSVFVEPAFRTYSSKTTIILERATSDLEFDVSVDYKSIDVPLGLRHYMYLNEKSKLFINAAVALAFDLSDKIDYDDNSIASVNNDLEIKSGANFFFGFGYEFNDRFSVELRTATDRNILSSYGFYSAPFSNEIGFVLGYKFL